MSRLTQKSVLKTLTLPVVLASLTVLSGCATTKIPERQLIYGKTQQTLQSQPVSIISDGCVIRIEAGNNDIMYQQSDQASRAIAQTLKTRLITKGVKVNDVSSPFICGSGSKEMLTKMDIMLTDGAKDRSNTTYPILSSTNNFDSETNKAYLGLYAALVKSRKSTDSDPTAYKNLNLDSNSLRMIKKLERANKVFVVVASGSQPSMGARVATGALGMVGMVAGVSNMDILTKGQNYAIYLVNLETNQVEWRKFGEIKGNMFTMPVDSSYNLPKMLDPLYAE